jgi:hypothetical protein
LTIQGDYEIEFRVPAAANERRAHGFVDDVCTLLIRARNDRNAASDLCNASQVMLPIGDTTLAIVFGDFDRTAAHLSHGLVALDSGPAPSMYRVSDLNVLRELFAANLESLVLIRGSSQHLSALALTWTTTEPPWWKFTRQSAIGRLANLHSVLRHILVFAPSEMSVELIGEKTSLIDALKRLHPGAAE